MRSRNATPARAAHEPRRVIEDLKEKEKNIPLKFFCFAPIFPTASCCFCSNEQLD
jgi:hypothetical protein